MTRWTDADDRKLRQLAGTTSAAAIGQVLGRGESAIYKRAQRIGVSLLRVGERRAGAKYSDELIERVRDLHDSGVGPTEISRRLGMNFHTVSSVVQFKHRLPHVVEK